MSNTTKLILFLPLLLLPLLFLQPTTTNAAPESSKDIPLSPPPRLQLPIPNAPQFSNLELQGPDEQRYLLIPWIAQYIGAVYRYAISLVGIVVVTVIVYGGMRWLTAAGDPGKITEAKNVIKNAVIGLLLTLGITLVLDVINPEILRFRAIKVSFIKPIYYESPDSNEPLASNIAENAPSDIYCPRSGGRDAIPRIVQSMAGKVVYRYGGGHRGTPPYVEHDARLLYLNNQPCPSGKMCLDCSGFVDYVLLCAGLPVPPGGTGVIFSSPNTQKIETRDWDNNKINGRELQPGDLIGWLPGELEHRDRPRIGHVILYIGNSQVAESTGGGRGVPGFNSVSSLPRPNSLRQVVDTWSSAYFTRVYIPQ